MHNSRTANPIEPEIVAGLKDQKQVSNPQKHSLGHHVPMKESGEEQEDDGSQNLNQEVAA
ncbi:MAG: hypothetical protein COY58_09245 [Gammaproteobacteria bacterium CG_4_10_14_0_8_um_filter_38_16]|nr:MAG: hypothetical protein COY58_09245 [Gammaproteobacteria bacterium CG_4_10_14_0_8_um_filter_38_16]